MPMVGQENLHVWASGRGILVCAAGGRCVYSERGASYAGQDEHEDNQTADKCVPKLVCREKGARHETLSLHRKDGHFNPLYSRVSVKPHLPGQGDKHLDSLERREEPGQKHIFSRCVILYICQSP